MIKLSLEFKVRLGFQDDLLQGFLEGLDSSLGVLAELCDSLVLSLAAEALLLCLVHLPGTGNMTDGSHTAGSHKSHITFSLQALHDSDI